MRRAATPCRHPGCSTLVRDGSGRCSMHVRLVSRETDERRGTAHSRGYDSRWNKARVAHLRAHPLCRHHEARGQLVAAVLVDHIVPHRGDMELFWDQDNWQSLCKRCHDRKTATVDRTKGGGSKGHGDADEDRRLVKSSQAGVGAGGVSDVGGLS